MTNNTRSFSIFFPLSSALHTSFVCSRCCCCYYYCCWCMMLLWTSLSYEFAFTCVIFIAKPIKHDANVSLLYWYLFACTYTHTPFPPVASTSTASNQHAEQTCEKLIFNDFAFHFCSRLFLLYHLSILVCGYCYMFVHSVVFVTKKYENVLIVKCEKVLTRFRSVMWLSLWRIHSKLCTEFYDALSLVLCLCSLCRCCWWTSFQMSFVFFFCWGLFWHKNRVLLREREQWIEQRSAK